MLLEQRLELRQEPQFVPALRQSLISATVVSFRARIASTMDFSSTPKQAQTVRPVSTRRAAGAQWLSGTTPTCGMCASPVLRACSSKPRLRQKNAPGMVVGITST